MIEQLQLNFDQANASAGGSASGKSEETSSEAPALPQSGRDAGLEAQALGWLEELDLREAADSLQIQWNRRMRSAAGKAFFPGWTIHLNPRLVQFEGETERTLKHELAHLVAYHRANGRRIKPHGAEWKQACADLGIPGEKACHTLPLPVARRERKHRYACPVCASEISRVRPLSKPAACFTCCRTKNKGRYDERFQLVKV